MPTLQKLLVITQPYPPDPTAVGPYLEQVVNEWAARGGAVVVYCSRHGYNDPSVTYPSEKKGAVSIVRLPFSSFGKRSMLMRILGQLLFIFQCIGLGLFESKVSHILISTTPPFASVVAMVLRKLKRIPITFWIMDLNPDQAVALGKFMKGSLPVRALSFLNRFTLKNAHSTVVLDRYMAERIRQRSGGECNPIVIPPWPRTDILTPIPHSNNSFRKQFAPSGERVFIYSGNITPASPLTTLLHAIPTIGAGAKFVLIGSGLAKKEVDKFIHDSEPDNIQTLPFQSKEDLKYSLSAGDIHIVTLGHNMTGIIHPSKVYAAMAVGRPILYVGPKPSPISDLIAKHNIGWECNSADPDELSQLIKSILMLPQAELEKRGQNGLNICNTELNQKTLLSLFLNAMMVNPQLTREQK